MKASHRYLLGYDIGSSSVKAALVDADTRSAVSVVHSPQDVMPMHAIRQGWAEQDPEMWWMHVCIATKALLQNTGVNPKEIKAIGIAYQMHGLVCVDKDKQVLRASIIWCDSRAVDIGNKAYDELGHDRCMQVLLNSPGNFTASKLAWVKQHEPEIYARIDKFMLPGDYIAMKLTDEIVTTPAGLSEGVMWDFVENAPAEFILEYFGFDKAMLPVIRPVFAAQGMVSDRAAQETGLCAGIPVSYRAGDQPNNAMALGVLRPGEIAASGGTSGVVYGIADRPVYDESLRVNCFMHVNHNSDAPRIGILLCINGAGSQYHWIKQHVADEGISYAQMETAAAKIPVGSDGVRILPFGNGAERMLDNKKIGAHILNLDFNMQGKAHLYRAALEGIAFSFVYGMDIMKTMGLQVERLRVGNDNLFQSEIFSKTISTLTGSRIDVIETTGAVGAAKAAGVATGIFNSIEEALEGIELVKSFEPEDEVEEYRQAFEEWTALLRDLKNS